MTTLIPDVPLYTGTVPNKDTQTQDIFDFAADGWIDYEYSELTPYLNTTFIPTLNTLSGELEAARDESLSYAQLSQAQAEASTLSAVNSENSSLAAESSAISVGTALAAANAILGLDLGTSVVDSSGHLIMTYNSGVVTPSLVNGHFVLEY